MEFEQIVKQLEWLDNERRKDKATIAAQVEHIAVLSSNLETLKEKIKILEGKTSDYASLPTRLEQFESFLSQHRDEVGEALRDVERKIPKKEQEINNRFYEELTPLKEELTSIRGQLDFSDIYRDLKVREKEDMRLNASFMELKAAFDEVVKGNKDLVHKQDLFEEKRKLDAKQFTDLQGEIAALRKRLDEERDKRHIESDSVKNMETRIAEVVASERKRKDEQTEFLEKFALEQIDRERAWKSWMEEADQFNKKTELLETYIQEADDTTRAAKKAEENYAEISQKIERRVHEIVEMQRLAEERMRQEWVTFKADDQKRWTGYGLSQDETMKNIQGSVKKMEERLTNVDDRFQIMQDQLQQTTDVTETQMQNLMNWAHEWLSAYERIMGHSKQDV